LRLPSFCIALLFLALSYAMPIAAANKPAGDSVVVGGSGLRCFSVTSPAALAKLPAEARKAQQASAMHWIAHASCDAICAGAGAACVAVGGYLGPAVCTDVPADYAVCRCCAVTH
jgi:hypothetical protein